LKVQYCKVADLEKVGRSVDRLHLAQDKGEWRASVKPLINFRVANYTGNSWLTEQLLGVSWRIIFQENILGHIHIKQFGEMLSGANHSPLTFRQVNIRFRKLQV